MTTTMKDTRRAKAAELQAARALRTPQEQLAMLDDRPGTSAKERARLMKMISEEKPTKEERRGNGKRKEQK